MRKKKLLLGRKGSIYARLRYERLPIFCFLCGQLGHLECFCPARIIHGKKELELEWDMSIKEVLRRVVVASNPWLREKGEGSRLGKLKEKLGKGSRGDGESIQGLF